MSQPAMSTNWDGRWSSLSDYELSEWLLVKDELWNKKVNDSTSNQSKCEIAEQVLHDIEELGRNNGDYWLDELPLFDEILSPKLTTEGGIESKREEEIGDLESILDQEQFRPKENSVAGDFTRRTSDSEDLFLASLENTATFIFSNAANILYLNEEPFVSFSSGEGKECEETLVDGGDGEKCRRSSNGIENCVMEPATDPSWEVVDDVAEAKREMAVVEEILKSTALELDQWESDTSRSDISSDGATTSSANRSPIVEEGDVETDDPEWRPESSMYEGRRPESSMYEGRRPGRRGGKAYWRGGSQEEKKLRKKEQNKNAATRYRQKKKAEVCEILKEEEHLRKKKAKLEEKAADIQSEIKCVKALMRDLFKAKGIIN